jgi:hypothetical protein
VNRNAESAIHQGITTLVTGNCGHGPAPCRDKELAGNYHGTIGPGQSHTPVLILDIQLKENTELTIPIKDDWNALAFIYEGNVFHGQNLSKGQLAVFEKDGDIHFKTNESGAGIYLAAGEPINEPVARGGPFVMNTKGEVLQAFSDFQNGKFEKEIKQD